MTEPTISSPAAEKPDAPELEKLMSALSGFLSREQRKEIEAAIRSLFALRGAPPKEPDRTKEFKDATGLEFEDGCWIVPAEPEPIVCDTLTEALQTWARLSGAPREEAPASREERERDKAHEAYVDLHTELEQARELVADAYSQFAYGEGNGWLWDGGLSTLERMSAYLHEHGLIEKHGQREWYRFSVAERSPSQDAPPKTKGATRCTCKTRAQTTRKTLADCPIHGEPCNLFPECSPDCPLTHDIADAPPSETLTKCPTCGAPAIETIEGYFAKQKYRYSEMPYSDTERKAKALDWLGENYLGLAAIDGNCGHAYRQSFNILEITEAAMKANRLASSLEGAKK